MICRSRDHDITSRIGINITPKNDKKISLILKIYTIKTNTILQTNILIKKIKSQNTNVCPNNLYAYDCIWKKVFENVGIDKNGKNLGITTSIGENIENQEIKLI